MFSGLVAEIGEVAAVRSSGAGSRLRVHAELAGELSGGDSVAVEGVCLTAAALGPDWFEADVMNQTLELTALAGTSAGRAVNLEPALRASDRLGGHIVQGHVDGVGEVVSVEPDGIARRLAVRLPSELRHLVVSHGSICLAGVSLTVAKLTDEGVEVSLIPETLERTTLGTAEVGDPLNVEVDVIARYVERLMQASREHGHAESFTQRLERNRR